MNDRQLDKLVRQAQFHAEMVGSLDLGRGGQELLEEIMSTSVRPQFDPSDAEPVEPSAPVQLFETVDLFETVELSAPVPLAPRRRRNALIGVAAAVAFVVAIAGPAMVFHRRNKATVVPAGQPAQAFTGASGNPQLLIDDPAWKISHVEESTPVSGELDFRKGKLTLSVAWYRADLYNFYSNDRRGVSKPVPIVVLGRNSSRFTYNSTDFAAMVPPQGKEKSFLEIRGGAGDEAAFETVLAELKPVSARKWLAAMPSSVVTPAGSAAAAKQMLADVPLPPGFDTSKLPAWGTNDYYQYGATVIGSVTCAWLDDYQAARAAGDKAGMARVDQVLSASHQWKVLRAMTQQGDYPEFVGVFVERVAKRQDAGDYRTSLGCS